MLLTVSSSLAATRKRAAAAFAKHLSMVDYVLRYPIRIVFDLSKY